MNSEELYRKRMEELLLLEIKAQIVYDTIYNNVEDPSIREALVTLKEDEKEHARIVKKLIALSR